MNDYAEKLEFQSPANLVESVETIVSAYKEPKVIELETPHGAAPVIAMPLGIELKSLKKFTDEYLEKPVRREGTAFLKDLRSFVEHVNRFKDADSVLFADDNRLSPSITAVLNYHRQGAEAEPRFGDHRAEYDLPVSKEWKAWTSANGKEVDQISFAAFLEDRIIDVMAVEKDNGLSERIQKFKKLIKGDFASPSKLMELSVGLSINADEKVTNTTNLQTGEVKVHYSCEHKDQAGDEVNVPKMFMIGIPVFKNGTVYQIAVRLRYRLRGGSIFWFFDMYQTDAVFDDAVSDACNEAADKTGLPLLVGLPE